MTHDDLVFEALAYLRNVGADLTAIRDYAKVREKRKRTTKNDRAALGRLEKAGMTLEVGQKWFLTSVGFKLAQGHAKQAHWLPEDSMILMALFICSPEEGCELQHIMGAADYIDRSYPSLENMHGALNRLAAGGLVKLRRGRYVLTEQATVLLAKVKANCKRGIRRQVHGLERTLECPCCGVELKKVRWPIVIDQAAMDEAYTKYRERMRAC